MSRTCTVCGHPQRAAIDQALMDGVPLREIAARYGLTDSSVARHKADHIAVALSKAQEAKEVAQGDDLLAQVASLQTRTLAILSKAEEAQDLRTALQGVAQARGNLELLAKLAGQLAQEGTVSLVISPEWILVRAALLGALVPYPEARLAVAGRLMALGSA